jgi:hypothetical protein
MIIPAFVDEVDCVECDSVGWVGLIVGKVERAMDFAPAK